ncbi:MAG: histidine kinase [Aquabacterium sp.]|uniref:sensor histidine kinase n=1 Tax=Aquabacterium sp. TaxID=1872578 RepID=UPI0025BC5FDB|nr:histidine kinase [Aquabacterium sp.]MBI5926255.1 histidine kinase [Aquabacterium sp.]
MLPSHSLDLSVDQVNTPATSDSVGSPFRTLLLPNAKRLLLTTTVWSVLMALYSRIMEAQGVAAPDQYGLWVYLSGNLGGGLIVFAMSMSGWYIAARHLWLRSEAARRRYAMEGMYALLPWRVALPLLTVLCLMGSAMSYGIWAEMVARTQEWPTLREQMNLGSNLAITLLYSTGVFSIDFFRVRAHMLRIRAETAQRLHVEAQLQRLQAQMEPHMLFNTLANLHALIETHPDKAQDMLAHLIDYLRATLSASRAAVAPLRDEMARVQDYLALMKIRMGRRLHVHTNVPADLLDIAVPPMLIQPLVENAIKHGLDPLPGGGSLHITVERDHDMLKICVRDDGQGLEKAGTTPSKSGFGLQCVQARLQTCYGLNARLMLASSLTEPGQAPAPTGTVATLFLPMQMPATSGISTLFTP